MLSNDEALVETVETDEFESDVFDYEAGNLEETVAVVTNDGATDPLKLQAADAIANAIDASVDIVQIPAKPAGDSGDASSAGFPGDLLERLSAPVDARTLEHDDPSVVATTVDDAELVFVGSEDLDVIHQTDDEDPDELWSEAGQGVVITRSRGETRSTPFSWLLDRLAS